MIIASQSISRSIWWCVDDGGVHNGRNYLYTRIAHEKLPSPHPPFKFLSFFLFFQIQPIISRWMADAGGDAICGCCSKLSSQTTSKNLPSQSQFRSRRLFHPKSLVLNLSVLPYSPPFLVYLLNYSFSQLRMVRAGVATATPQLAVAVPVAKVSTKTPLTLK